MHLKMLRQWFSLGLKLDTKLTDIFNLIWRPQQTLFYCRWVWNRPTDQLRDGHEKLIYPTQKREDLWRIREEKNIPLVSNGWVGNDERKTAGGEKRADGEGEFTKPENLPLEIRRNWSMPLTMAEKVDNGGCICLWGAICQWLRKLEKAVNVNVSTGWSAFTVQQGRRRRDVHGVGL